MNKFNVVQKFIAFLAACISLVAVFALSGNGFAEWAFIELAAANAPCGGGTTEWYHSVTVYDPAKNAVWQKTDYVRGESIAMTDVTLAGGAEITLAKAVYNYLETVTISKRACLQDENGKEIASFATRTDESEYLSLSSGNLVLKFHDIDLSVAKDYVFYINVT